MRRIGSDLAPLERWRSARRRSAVAAPNDARQSEFALVYSNGYVTVEISHAALDAYIEMTGDVPLPVVLDPATGDRRTYDARHKVRVVYDASAAIREVATRSRDGLYVRLNFTDAQSETRPRSERRF